MGLKLARTQLKRTKICADDDRVPPVQTPNFFPIYFSIIFFKLVNLATGAGVARAPIQICPLPRSEYVLKTLLHESSLQSTRTTPDPPRALGQTEDVKPRPLATACTNPEDGQSWDRTAIDSLTTVHQTRVLHCPSTGPLDAGACSGLQ